MLWIYDPSASCFACFFWFFGDSIEYGQMILVEFDPEMWAHERSPQTARVRSLCVLLDFTTCQM